jgi:hypothetical protein
MIDFILVVMVLVCCIACWVCLKEMWDWFDLGK